MKSYFENILPKILAFSNKLDALSNLVDEPWSVYNSPKEKYIFRQNNQLLYSNNGNVSIGKWELLNKANSILIEQNNTFRLFNHGFLDDSILMLRIDGGDELFILTNTNKISNFEIEKYIEETYLKKTQHIISQISKSQRILSEIESDKGLITIKFLTNINTPSLGDEVLINSKPAPDGKYKIGSMFYIKVVEGRITSKSLF
jgi:hypothetical protein